MKKWIHKIDISVTELDRELNAFSSQGYEIYKLWKSSYGKYEIVAYKEEKDKISNQPSAQGKPTIVGYQPISGQLDSSKPPQGGSGIHNPKEVFSDKKKIKKLNLPEPKNPLGYTKEEISEILKTYNISEKVFNEKFGVNTCPVLPGGICGYYKWDVELTIRLCLENRNRTLAEWD